MKATERVVEFILKALWKSQKKLSGALGVLGAITKLPVCQLLVNVHACNAWCIHRACICPDMASILFVVVMCFTAGYAAPLHQGSGSFEALFDASLHLGEIIAYVTEWDKSHVRAAVVGDLFAGDGHLYEAAMKRGYQSWKYDMIYDPIMQNILTKRHKSHKVFQGSRWAPKRTVRPLGG